MAIVASSSVPLKTISTALNTGFGVRPRFGASMATFADPPPNQRSNETLLIDLPGSQQSSIRLVYRAQTATTRLSEVGVPFVAGAINDKLRHQEGVSYGASGDAVAGRAFSLVRLSASVQTTATADAIATMIREAKGGQSIDEIELDSQVLFTRNVAYQQSISQLQRSLALVDQFTRMYFDQQTWADYKSSNVRRQAATSTDISSAKAAVSLKTGHLIIVAGDISKFRDSLNDAELGTIRTIKPEL
jgi:hypothetical protein